MIVSLHAWQEKGQCTWCEKEKECVSATFEDGFLKNSSLCWGCLQKAVKVRSRQVEIKPPLSKSTN
ncbi:MAG: hypothetical protein ACKVT0_05365 [Planctomycetaceae bacterium]